MAAEAATQATTQAGGSSGDFQPEAPAPLGLAARGVRARMAAGSPLLLASAAAAALRGDAGISSVSAAREGPVDDARDLAAGELARFGGMARGGAETGRCARAVKARAPFARLRPRPS